MGEGKIKLGIPYKGTIIGVEVPEKVAILGMKISTKVLAALGLTGLIGLGIAIAAYYLSKKPSAQQSTGESPSLQG